MSFLAELKRRNVLRVGAAYIVTAWLVIQVVETIFPAFGFGDAAVRYTTIAFAIGLIPTIILAWVFEWTPEGLKRDSDVDSQAPSSLAAAKRLDRIILVVLAIALGYFAFDKFVLDPARDERIAESARQEGRTEAMVESYGDASIAVLAFENMSPEPDQAYFAEGISENILNLLASIPDLRVISRSSAFTYKGTNTPIPQIAEELNVVHVLEGSVRKVGNQVRVTAQLIDGRSDTHLWSRSWDRALDDLFAIQDDIASDVVDQLHVTLAGDLPKSRRTDPEAYALTLQARQVNELSLNAPGMKTYVRELLDHALSIDPDHVPAMELKLLNNFRLMEEGIMSREEERRRASALRERILSIDPDNRLVTSYLAWETYDHDREIEAAAEAFAALLPRSLNDAEILRVIAGFLRRIGKFDESILVNKRCVEVDPLKLGCRWQLRETYFWAMDFEQSRVYAERINRFFAREAGANDVYRTLLEGQPEEAKTLAMKLPDPLEKTYLLMLAAHDLGDTEGFEQYQAEFQGMGADDEHHARWSRRAAIVHAYLGQIDLAFDDLYRWVEADESDAFRALLGPWWRPLHGDARWPELRARLGISQARLDGIEFPLPPQLVVESG